MRERRGYLSIVAGGFLIAVCAAAGIDRVIKPAVFSGVIFILAALIVALKTVISRRSLLDNPIYIALFAYLVFVGMGPLLARIISPGSISSDVLINIRAWPLVVSWAGFAALGAGYWLGRRWSNNSSSAGPSRPYEGKGSLSYLLWASIFFTLLGFIGVFAYLRTVGGIAYLIQTPYGLRGNPSVLTGLFSLLRPGLFLLIAWSMALNQRSTWLTTGVLAYITFDLIWFGPLRGSRQDIITLVLTLVYLARYCGTSHVAHGYAFWMRRWLLVAGVCLALVWGGLRSYSLATLVGLQRASLDVSQATESATLSALYAPYDSFVRIVDLVPNFIPYQGYATFYESLTVFVPRPLWRSKPLSRADWLSATLYGPRTGGNTAPTWPGELYLDFGIVGVVFGLLVLGLVCAWAIRLIPLANTSGLLRARQGLLSAVWFPLPLEWVWGGSISAVWYLMLNVIPIYFVLWFIRSSSARSSAGTS